MTLDELRALATYERDGYHVFESPYAQMAVTLEDAEFLYALVRLVRPARVLEFGTGLGVSARFIAEALAANGTGELFTVEPNADLASHAAILLSGLPAKQVKETPLLVKRPDFVFVDSGFDRRGDDIARWLTNSYDGLVCVHDSKRGYDLHGAQGVFLPGVDGLWLGRAA